MAVLCGANHNVGKTSTTVNLGIGLAREGRRVLAIDMDAQGSLTASLGYQHPEQIQTTLASVLGRLLVNEPIAPGEGIIHHAEGVDLLPANKELSSLEITLVNAMARETYLRMYLNSIRDQYDVILLDCCPSFGHIADAERTTIIKSTYQPSAVLTNNQSCAGLFCLEGVKQKRVNPISYGESSSFLMAAVLS